MPEPQQMIQLLTGIRDNQLSQMRWSEGASTSSQRGVLITAVVAGIGIGFLLTGVLMMMMR